MGLDRHRAHAPEELADQLQEILKALEADSAIIADQLNRRHPIDTAAIRLALARIRQQCNGFSQLLARTARVRSAETDSLEAQTWAALMPRLGSVRTWIGHWPRIEMLVQAQVRPRKRGLYAKRSDEAVAQMRATDQVFNDLHGILNPSQQDDGANKHGCFADIPLPMSQFMAHLQAARRVILEQRLRHTPRFLDVGCGGGLKVLTARSYFEHADGLEYDPGYVSVAKALFDRSKTGGLEVLHADGLTFGGYDTYDVIYFYQPMRDQEMLCALERQITSTARPGTLIIAPYDVFGLHYKTLGCARLAHRLYVTGISQREADGLRRRAEYMGHDPGLNKLRVPSVWNPILMASTQNGYGNPF